MAEVKFLNVGLPKKTPYGDSKSMYSGILKSSVPGPIYLGKLGFKKDGSADKRFHGGEDKAVCVYSYNHYPFWNNEFSREILPGAFGENLTLSGLDETQVCLGDIYSLGETQVQVSLPREPCHKLNKIFDRKDMACRVQKMGYSGFYVRVLKTGMVEAGNAFTLIEKGLEEISIAEANDLMFRKEKRDYDRIEAALNLGFLSEDWKRGYRRRLAKRKS
jgi:MOSC domain-containing protein YiiM|tara:strand:- start:23 stop:676 length:654 start_codon:yes stop_codon:yes gene_type:complete